MAIQRIIDGRDANNVAFQSHKIGELFHTTQGAAEPERPWHDEYRGMYVAALGEQAATDFLKIFNEAVERYKDALAADGKRKRNAKLVFDEKQQGVVIGCLEKLLESAKGPDGFYLPYPNMGLAEHV